MTPYCIISNGSCDQQLIYLDQPDGSTGSSFVYLFFVLLLVVLTVFCLLVVLVWTSGLWYAILEEY